MPAKAKSFENETVIIFNEVEEEARLWTAEKKVAKAWKKMGVVVEERPSGSGWWAKAPKSWVVIRPPKKWD